MTLSAFWKLLESSEQGQSLNFDKMYIQYPETSSPDAHFPLHSIPCPNGDEKKNPLKDWAPEGCISWHYFLGRQVSAIQNK